MVQRSTGIAVIDAALSFLSLPRLRRQNRPVQSRSSLHDDRAVSFRVPGRAFPVRAVTILALVMAVHSFAFVSLFPYVGIMVTELLDLETTNKAGTVGACETTDLYERAYYCGTTTVDYVQPGESLGCTTVVPLGA